MNRRSFLRMSGLAGASGLAWAGMPSRLRGEPILPGLAAAPTPLGHAPGHYGPLLDGALRLVVLHTNDTHSRLDPFPMDEGRFAGLGGAARRHTLIKRIREANEHVLLLDSGDIFQGTPYFNYHDGEPEFKVMSAMEYDAATLGNHDFDNGVDGLARMLPEAKFDFVSANYDVTGSALEGSVQPYVIREAGPIKVGIFGLGISFEGLVLAKLHEGVRYADPVERARATARELRDQGCSLVVCLSHLGYRYRGSRRPSDRAVAAFVPEIDLILGGHTHTFMDRPVEVGRLGRPNALIHQVGWGGMRLGRIDAAFDESGRFAGWTGGGYDIDQRLD